MRTLKNFLIPVVLVLALAASAFADVTGTWNGKFVKSKDAGKMKSDDPKMQARLDQMMASLSKATWTLTLNKDHTYKAVAKGLGGRMKDMVTEGTWSQKGDIVTLKVTKVNGKAPEAGGPMMGKGPKGGQAGKNGPRQGGGRGMGGMNRPRELVLSKNGKTLTSKNGGRMPGEIVYHKK